MFKSYIGFRVRLSICTVAYYLRFMQQLLRKSGRKTLHWKIFQASKVVLLTSALNCFGKSRFQSSSVICSWYNFIPTCLHCFSSICFVCSWSSTKSLSLFSRFLSFSRFFTLYIKTKKQKEVRILVLHTGRHSVLGIEFSLPSLNLLSLVCSTLFLN